MPHNFGLHVALEIVGQAQSFLAHVEDEAVWKQLSEPLRGRMTHADVAKGRERLAAAQAALAGSASAAGGSAHATYALDSAHDAAVGWLQDQLTHARGRLHEERDDASLAALDAAVSRRRGHADVAADVRAYVTLVQKDDAAGAALSAAYASAKSRDAILKDGLHLADAVDAIVAAPGAAKGDRVGATAAKDAAVDALARWTHRWTAVARAVLGAADLQRLGLGAARHHPAHREAHPSAAPAPPPATS